MTIQTWTVAATETKIYASQIHQDFARLYQYPMQDVTIVAETGRFALVRYTPHGDEDPDLIIDTHMDPTINAAILAFHNVRFNYTHSNREWYTLANKKLNEMDITLEHTTEAERRFVLNWAEDILARRKNASGPRPPLPNLKLEEPKPKPTFWEKLLRTL